MTGSPLTGADDGSAGASGASGVGPAPASAEYAYHPWVRRACGRAALGGGAGLVVLLLVARASQGDASGPLGPAALVAGFYGLVFLGTLVKIAHATRRPLAQVGPGGLALRPLHALRARRIPWHAFRGIAPRPGTHGLELVVEELDGRRRELQVNLALLADRPAFLHGLGRWLVAAGLEPDPERRDAWRAPGDGATMGG